MKKLLKQLIDECKDCKECDDLKTHVEVCRKPKNKMIGVFLKVHSKDFS